MGLNPSCNLSGDLKGFINLGDPPFDEASKNIAKDELIAAGFPRTSSRIISREIEVFKPGSDADHMQRSGVIIPSVMNDAPTEWQTAYEVEAHMFGWKFVRFWYYWSAYVTNEGDKISKKEAKQFNKEWRTQVRVEGFAGGQDVRGPVGGYNIDTPAGLNAFASLLTDIRKKRNEEYRRRCDQIDEKLRNKVE